MMTTRSSTAARKSLGGSEKMARKPPWSTVFFFHGQQSDQFVSGDCFARQVPGSEQLQ